MKLTPSQCMWIAVIACVVLSTTMDGVSTQFWKKQNYWLLIPILIVSPCVFLLFGYVGSQNGLALASSLTNSLIVIGPIMVGLIFFSEWEKMTLPLYVGMFLIVAGIAIVVWFRTEGG